jgi:hypothetical protein
MDKSVQTDVPPYAFHKILGSKEVIDDIYKKLNTIESVLGYILEKTKDLPIRNPPEEAVLLEETVLPEEAVLPVE